MGGGEAGEKERSGCRGTCGGRSGGGTEFAVQKRSVGLRQEGFAVGGEGGVDGGVGKCSVAPRCAQYYV